MRACDNPMSLSNACVCVGTLTWTRSADKIPALSQTRSKRHTKMDVDEAMESADMSNAEDAKDHIEAEEAEKWGVRLDTVENNYIMFLHDALGQNTTFFSREYEVFCSPTLRDTVNNHP